VWITAGVARTAADNRRGDFFHTQTATARVLVDSLLAFLMKLLSTHAMQDCVTLARPQ
jgi:hypothetical protein